MSDRNARRKIQADYDRGIDKIVRDRFVAGAPSEETPPAVPTWLKLRRERSKNKK